MRGRWTALAVGLALAGSAAVLTGCGVSRTIDPVAAAATKTQSAGSAKLALAVEVTAGGKTYSVTANGVLGDHAADVTADLSDVLGAAGLSGTSGSAELRFLQEGGDPVVYLSAPFLSSRLPGAPAWIRLDLQQASEAMGKDLNGLLAQAGQNPAQVLDMLRASGEVVEVGTETVNGESTTHYRATIDLAKAADQLGPDAQAMLKRLSAAGAPTTFPVDVWIGDDGLVRRVVLDESFSANGQSGGAKVTLDLSDYGTPVDVTAPPSADTLDLTGLASQALKGASSGGWLQSGSSRS
jgi:hypothetical protein